MSSTCTFEWGLHCLRIRDHPPEYNKLTDRFTFSWGLKAQADHWLLTVALIALVGITDSVLGGSGLLIRNELYDLQLKGCFMTLLNFQAFPRISWALPLYPGILWKLTVFPRISWELPVFSRISCELPVFPRISYEFAVFPRISYELAVFPRNSWRLLASSWDPLFWLIDKMTHLA